MREQIEDVRIETLDSFPTIEPGRRVPAVKLLLRAACGWRAHVPIASHVTVRLFSRNLAPRLRPAKETMAARSAQETAPPLVAVVAPPLEDMVAPIPEELVAPLPEELVAPLPEELVAPLPEELVAPLPEEMMAPPPAPPLTEEPLVPPPEWEVLERTVREKRAPLELDEEPPPIAARNKRSAAPLHQSPVIGRKHRKTNEEKTAAPTVEEMPGEKRQQSAVGEAQRASLSQMLQTSGLHTSLLEREQHKEREKQRCSSNSSETQLGSLDRTLVSLGDPVPPSQSTIFLRENWGPEGTILKIIGALRAEQRPLTVERLVTLGPQRPDGVTARAVVAYCFGSILKLKQARFLKVMKNPDTLEVVDMDYGDKIKLN